MRSGGFTRASRLEKKEPGISGVLRVELGDGETRIVEFVPSRAQNRVYRAAARSREGLRRQLELLGVPAGQQPKILSARTSWCREVTLAPSPAAWEQIVGGARGTGAG